ncbi:MAG: glutamate racemase [Prevotellaceae bacterium]|jgi:glutamate racemase|nr:glutamate racemase [Prevotellaceae bacterium]
MSSDAPIGIFDSGVGGLSVLKEIVKLLPLEDVVYVADAKNCPYGEKPKEEVLRLSINIVDFLLKKGSKLIAVACNTATAAAIDELRRLYPDIPFVGMEPAVKPAARQSKTGNVGILATAGTFKGRLFNETSQRYASNVKLHEAVGSGLVDLVEQGKEDSDEAVKLLQKYLQPMLDNNIDELVLGCTHYPFLQNSIEKITKGRVELVNPAPAVAVQVKHILERHDLLNSGEESRKIEFYSTRDADLLRQMQNRHIAAPAGTICLFSNLTL